LIKAKDGTEIKSQDILAEVGSFQVTLTSPRKIALLLLLLAQA
jgi:hypothetical protein